VLTTHVLLAAILVPLGVLAFREPWSGPRGVGVVLALAGLWLLNRG
jgi:drug/metabolite transporter (DMT)-like permease